MSLIAVAIVVLGVANNALFAQVPHITETISGSLLSTTHKIEILAQNVSHRATAAVADTTQNIKLLLDRAEPQEIVIGFEDDSYEENYVPQIARAEPVSVEVFEQNSFPPQTEPLYGAQIYTPENTYTTINSKDIEQRLLIQKNYFSKQIDRIYDRVKSNTQDVNDRVDSITTTSSGISFATIALGGTGISTVPSYGQLLMGDGSGGYTLIATSSLGISSGGSSQWTTSGSDIYYTTGSVGIGTTTPQYGLHIYESMGSASQNIQTADAAGEAAINLENTVRRWKIKATTASGDAFVIRDQTAGQDRFVIGNTGNIGIGSTSPTSNLSVLGNSYFGGNVTIGATASGPQLTVNAQGNGNDTEFIIGDGLGQYWGLTRENSVGNAARGDLSFYSTDARAGDLLTLGTRGLVGIGTTSPYAKLSVAGTSVASTTLALRPISGQTANILDVYNTSGVLNTVITAAGNVGIGTSSPAVRLQIGSGYANFDNSYGLTFANAGATDRDIARILYSPSGTLDFYNADAVRMTVGYGGNIGIGTTAPGNLLSLYKNTGSLISSIQSNGIAWAGLKISDLADPMTYWNSGSNFRWGVTTANDGVTGFSEYMRISSTGNLGVGTSSPLAKLDIYDASANSAIVLSSGYNTGADSNKNWGLFQSGFNYGDFAIKESNVVGGNPISAGTTRLLIQKVTGNVGIGTTSPASILHLDSGTASLPSISLSASGGSLQTIGRATASFTGAATTDLGIRFSNKLWLGNTGTASAVLDSSGNFGIGTTTPAGNLEVLGSTGIYSRNSSGGRIVFDDSDVASASTPMTYITGADGSLQFGRANRAASGLTTGSAESLRITSTGNVGIGTTTPAARLDVAGTIAQDSPIARFSFGGTWNDEMRIVPGGANGTDPSLRLYRTTGVGLNYNPYEMKLVAGGSLQFNTGSSAAKGSESYTTNTMTLSAAGNVGIGTTTPSVKLETYTTGTFSLAASSNNGSLWFGHDATTNFIQSVATNRTSAQNLYIGGYATQAPALTEIEGASIFLNGNVGIGTSTPQRALSIYKSSSPVLQLTDSTAGESVNDGFLLTQSGLSTYLENTEAGPMYFRTSAANRMVIGANGNVGIGTTTTDVANISEKLVVTGDIFIDNIAFNSGMALGMIGGVPYIQGANAANTGVKNLLLQPSGGSVGIGTTSPASLLHLSGNGGVPQLIISGTAAGQNMKDWRFVADSTSLFLGTLNESTTATGDYAIRLGRETNSNDVDYIEFATNNEANKMRFTNSGNLGIGTTTPQSKLVISETVSNTLPLVIEGTMPSSNNYTGIGFQRTGEGEIGRISMIAEPITGERSFQFLTDTGSAVTEAMRIRGSGNVGIGTTTPNQKLVVSGSLYLAGNGINNGIYMDGFNSSASPTIIVTNNNTLTFRTPAGNVNGLSHTFLNHTGSSLLNIMSNGNIGIGTTSPTYKLEVAGDVGATSFINMSSRSVKKDITYVPFEQTQQTLDKIKALKFATYRYVTENDSEPLHLGLIAEESPEDILAPGGRGIDVYKLATFALQGIQSLIVRIEKLEAALANVSTGFTDIFKAKTVEVEQGITIKDSKTGEYYCIVVENGSMKNIPGKCGTASTDSSNNEDPSDSDDSENNDSSDNDDSDNESEETSDNSDDSSNSTDSSDSSSSSDNQNSQNDETDEEQETVEDSSEDSDTESDDATTTNVDNAGDTSETESSDSSTETENNDTVNPSEESSDSSTDSSSETVSDPSDSESTSSETSDSSSSESTDSPSGSESSPSDSSDSSGSTESSSSSESSSSTDGGSSDTQ